jgi:ketosteroid isomerase-like protein
MEIKPSAESETAAESSAPSKANSPADEDAQTVAALDSEFHSAMKTNDAATMDRILADDFVMVHDAGQTMSKTDLLKQARDKQAKYEHHEIEQGSQKVRVWRDTAVVTETLWVKGSENGKPVDQKVPITETYVRTPNGWRYVSGQASPGGK